MMALVGSSLPLLRDMLVAELPEPAYIVASPKYSSCPISDTNNQVYDRRTFGDNIGIIGLISVFGAILGDSASVELISPQYCDPRIIDEPKNLYLIGSPKINPISKMLLELLQKNKEPSWHFSSLQDTSNESDYIAHLSKYDRGSKITYEAKLMNPQKGIFDEDYGVIIRIPHPKFEGRIILLVAGAHSLGTGAACLAVSKSSLINQVNNKLPKDIDLSEKTKAFWALVRGKAIDDDGFLDENHVSIIDAGTFSDKGRRAYTGM